MVTHRFQQFLERHGLPRQRFHDLRHASASFHLKGGLPAKAVADRLGHSTVRLTLDTYEHLGADTQHLAAAEMERVLAGDAGRSGGSTGTGSS